MAEERAGSAPAPPRFPIRIGRWSRLVLLPWGVWGRDRAEVTIQDGQLVVRFGWFGARIALADIERWDLTGPFIWIRAIAVRHTVFKSDVSFLGSAHGAVRLWLRTPRRIAWVRRADQVYVGVDDLAGLAADLTLLGIPGEDRRPEDTRNHDERREDVG